MNEQDQQPIPPAPSGQPTPPVNPSSESNYAVLLGLSPLIGIFSAGFFLPVVVPLVLWLVWKDQYPRIDRVGKHVLNGQISWCIWMIIASVISGILMFILIGWLTIWIAPLLWLIFTIIQAVKISNGEDNYEMPLTITFLR